MSSPSAFEFSFHIYFKSNENNDTMFTERSVIKISPYCCDKIFFFREFHLILVARIGLLLLVLVPQAT